MRFTSRSDVSAELAGDLIVMVIQETVQGAGSRADILEYEKRVKSLLEDTDDIDPKMQKRPKTCK